MIIWNGCIEFVEIRGEGGNGACLQPEEPALRIDGPLHIEVVANTLRSLSRPCSKGVDLRIIDDLLIMNDIPRYDPPLLVEAEVVGGHLPADQSLPEALHVVDAAGGVDFRIVETVGGETTWEVTLEVAERNHERVDAVYDLVLALLLPTADDGSAAFEASTGLPIAIA